MLRTGPEAQAQAEEPETDEAPNARGRSGRARTINLGHKPLKLQAGGEINLLIFWHHFSASL
jgi:hypothetical protein